MNLIEPLLKILLIFLLQLRIAGRTVDFGGLVFTFGEFFLGPLIVDVSFVRFVEDFLHEAMEIAIKVLS